MTESTKAIRAILQSPARCESSAGGGTISVYRHPSEFPARLLDFFAEAESISMQLGADWFRNLVDTVFAQQSEVKFYVLDFDGTPAAVLPLACTRTRLGWRVQALSNYYTALFTPLLRRNLAAQDLALLLKAVVRDHRGLGTMKFAPLAHGEATFRTLEAALKMAGLVSFPYFCFGNWYMTVDQPWAPYYQSRESRQKNTINRMGKKFAAEGGRLEIITGGDIERGLQAYADVYAASWKQPEPYEDFMPGLIRLCAERGWLRLGVAWIGSKPVASQIWIVAHGKADIYKLAYDEKHKHLSPGTLLTVLLMQTAMDVDKAKEIDYLIGDDPYKESWMSMRRERWGLIAYNSRSSAGLLGLGIELSGRCAKFLRAKLT